MQKDRLAAPGRAVSIARRRAPPRRRSLGDGAEAPRAATARARARRARRRARRREARARRDVREAVKGGGAFGAPAAGRGRGRGAGRVARGEVGPDLVEVLGALARGDGWAEGRGQRARLERCPVEAAEEGMRAERGGAVGAKPEALGRLLLQQALEQGGRLGGEVAGELQLLAADRLLERRAALLLVVGEWAGGAAGERLAGKRRREKLSSLHSKAPNSIRKLQTAPNSTPKPPIPPPKHPAHPTRRTPWPGRAAPRRASRARGRQRTTSQPPCRALSRRRPARRRSASARDG